VKELPPIDELWRLYLAVGSVHRLGDLIGISHSRIHRVLASAGYKLKGSKFTPEEDETIRRYYDETPPEDFSLQELTQILKRPHHTNVSRRARQLGLTDKSRPPNLKAREKVGRAQKEWHANNPHPRGMKGKRHSEEALKIIGQKSKELWESLSREERAAQVLKAMKTKARNGILLRPRKNVTWKQGWYIVGGKRYYFRSTWEVCYAKYLQWLKENKQIVDWEYEADTFWFEKVKRGTRCYTPDFKVTMLDGDVEYHEVKGWMDSRSKTKLRRMKIYHPSVKVVLIDAKTYRSLKASLGSIMDAPLISNDPSGSIC